MKRKNKRKIIFSILVIIIIILGFIAFMPEKEEEVIEVGFIGPLTGDYAVYGKRFTNGLELAMNEINEKGGINGKELKIIFEDSAGDTAQAISAAQKLIDFDKISIIFASLSNEVLGIAPITEKNKVILFSPAAGSEKIRDAGDYVFRNRETGEVHGKEIGELVYNLGIKKTAVIYVNADAGISYKEGFIKRYQEMGGEIVYEENYPKGELNYRTILLKMKSNNPGAAYFPGYGNDIGLILKQAKELDLDYRFFSSPGLEIPELFDISGNGSENVIYSVSMFIPDNPERKKYAESYRQNYGEDSEFVSANSYDALKMVVLAIESCNGEKDTSCIKDFLYKIKDYPGIGGLTSFDEDGEVIKPVLFKQVKNREFVPYEE